MTNSAKPNLVLIHDRGSHPNRTELIVPQFIQRS